MKLALCIPINRDRVTRRQTLQTSTNISKGLQHSSCAKLISS